MCSFEVGFHGQLRRMRPLGCTIFLQVEGRRQRNIGAAVDAKGGVEGAVGIQADQCGCVGRR